VRRVYSKALFAKKIRTKNAIQHVLLAMAHWFHSVESVNQDFILITTHANNVMKDAPSVWITLLIIVLSARWGSISKIKQVVFFYVMLGFTRMIKVCKVLCVQHVMKAA